MVHYAVGLPNVGEFGDPEVLVELAVAAEEHGWDGVYLWDHLLYHDRDWPVASPTVVLSAIAARTRRIRLGVLMAALPRRRVQMVAKESATLDRLSGGRLVFGAGLGSMDEEYTDFGEDPDLKVRAAKLDRGLEELTRLWERLPPVPAQRPRIPIWCPGRWPTRAGFRRAARWDGAMPTFQDYGQERPVPVDEFARVVDFLGEERGSLDGFDIALEGRAADGLVDGYVAAGMTWWVEAMGWWRGGVRDARETVTAGPPRG
ncbi:LLM class flavin-dependent oxidoreductase [Nonomuraea sp. NPDC050404]|uniref:LLM class flavin-dependent oxidoreductase n=1 Tax=Nonomuraea sp. NPDC050404 TaxID=3155783 RepID=UPI0033DE9612